MCWGWCGGVGVLLCWYDVAHGGGGAESAGGLRFSRQGSETDDLAIFGIDTVAVARLAGPIF